ncbi:hypothetical protein OAD61_00245, partial [bacterium]|nr:hypothetical protein [bacterium]
MAAPKDKKKMKGFKEFDPSKFINTEPTISEAVKGNTVVIAFGRMNPITVGHEKLVEKVISEAQKRKAEPMVFLSHSSGAKTKTGKGSVNKDPLQYEDKIKYAIKAFGPVVKKSPLKILMLIAKTLAGKYKNLVMVAGSDRVDEYTALLNKYNGKDYNFESIEVVSAGQRDPDSEGASGMSGTKMREFAANGDINKFAAGLPKALKSSAEEIMNKVASAMNPELTEEVEELDEVLTRMQRRKRGLAMKKARFKIKRGREKAAKRTASQEVLKKRAKKAAINIFKKKFSKNKRYAELSPGEKEVIDKRIAKINTKRIDQIARKLLPAVKQKERDRRKSMMSNKNEGINEASLADTKTLKRPHQLMDANNKPKFDGRFRMFKKKNVNETVEDLYEELTDLIEATEQFNEGKKPGLWDNIHAKRKRIKSGSGEKMRKPGSKGAPTDSDFKTASESVELDEVLKPSDDMGTWVKDFQDSDAPQFKGKSKEDRRKMAVAAKLAAERNEDTDLDELSLSVKDITKSGLKNSSKNSDKLKADLKAMRDRLNKIKKEEYEKLDEMFDKVHPMLKKELGSH